ncbi:hypothetical protein B296_00000904 [Ensete ventricosum]|uniref:Uncharacterized protein n=1 Tax=Ensete ventricosum TaxID=4639 RepID=A0A427AKX4_ENSVE|nr:hypothetical protein B296_00000904 [Ensete ventricosum]
MAPRFWSWKEESRRRHRRFGWNVTRPSRFPAWLASKVLELWRERSRHLHISCAHPKRPTLGLERAPRRCLFEARRLEIKRLASPRLSA